MVAGGIFVTVNVRICRSLQP